MLVWGLRLSGDTFLNLFLGAWVSLSLVGPIMILLSVFLFEIAFEPSALLYDILFCSVRVFMHLMSFILKKKVLFFITAGAIWRP